MWQSPEILNVFNTFNFEKKKFWKTKTFFEKLEYRFLVENTKIEITTYPYKIALSEANIKTKTMDSTKWSIPKNGVLPVTTYFYENFVFVQVNLMY